MRAALALARRGLGRTAPNPSVAALVVDPRRDPPVMLGRGVTAPGGRPHAEDLALAQAGAAARGATLYVTLEPCARRSARWYGPSCTDLILASGIARVVVAGADPSPFAAGEGAARLRAAGIVVEEGVLADEAARLNQGHCQRVRLNRPFTRVKLAMTADGFAATPDRRPLAITGEAARGHVHRLRADVDALVTGIGTVLADDPLLDVRLPGMAEFSPLRVILDTEARIVADLRIIRDAARVPVLVLTAAPDRAAAVLAGGAAEIAAVPRGADGRLDLDACFGLLAARGITRAMVEAGPALAEAVAAAGHCDEFVRLTGPEAAGAGLPATGPALAAWLAAAERIETRFWGADYAETFVRRL
jgi:diaminohydroxyphosphoribosylaminopyrimidine deaminase/5-amino-6-(5-phosphoribosylamino)uracil reductase